MMMTQHPLKIAPSILAADFGHLADAVRTAEQGGADYIHLDIMDGRFVPNISFGPPIVAAVRQVTDLPLDVHLMIEEPERYVEAFVEAGANVLTVHAEACVHLHRTVQHITELGCRAGVSSTRPRRSKPREITVRRLAIGMTVNPGLAQRFIETAPARYAACAKCKRS